MKMAHGGFAYPAREAVVKTYQESDCVDTLLDMVCYEVFAKRLSREMEEILQRHLSCCPYCRRRVGGMRRIVRRNVALKNFD